MKNLPDEPVKVVDSPKDLIDVVELTDVVFYQVSGLRLAAGADPEDRKLEIEVAIRLGTHVLEVRCRASIRGGGGEYLCDASAEFTLRCALEIPDPVLIEFVERVGVMAVYPYLREAITESAAKLRLDVPVLSLLRPGDVRITSS